MPGGQVVVAPQKNSHTREFAGVTWYSRPQVGVVPAGAPAQAAPSVVHVFVQRLRPCSAPTLMQTSPGAHCGSPCKRSGAHACANPGKPTVMSVPVSVAPASSDVRLLLHPNADNNPSNTIEPAIVLVMR